MSRVAKLFAVVSVLGALALSGCNGDDPDDNAEPDPSLSEVQADPGDGSVGSDDDGDPAGAGDDDGEDGKGEDGKGEDGKGDDEPEPAGDPGPCEAVLPYSEVEDILDDPEPGTLTSGGEVINSCTWVGADDETLVVKALDPSFAGLQGIDPKLANNPIKGLGEEAGSMISKKDPRSAEVQVWAFVKGSGKELPLLYVVTWTGSNAEVEPLVEVARRIV